MTQPVPPTPPKSSYYRDLAERVGFTALEAGLGALSASALGIPEVWAVPFAAALAVIKGLIAKKIGNPDTASTVV